MKPWWPLVANCFEMRPVGLIRRDPHELPIGPALAYHRHPDCRKRPGTADTQRIQSWLGHRGIQHTVRYTELSARPFKEFWR